jgi:WD40 repeat protein
MTSPHNDPMSWAFSPRPHDQPERVPCGTWRVPLWAWQCLVVFVLIGVTAVFSTYQFGGSQDRPAERSPPRKDSRRGEAVAFSPDGRTLASCGWDNFVYLWDVRHPDDKRVVEPQLLPHKSVQLALAFSPDSKTLAAGGYESLSLWVREADHYKMLIEDEGTTYRCLAFSPDGHSLALGADDHTVRIWDLPSARVRAVLIGHVDVVRSVAFSPDGRRLMSTGQDRLVMLWDAINGEAIHPLGGAGSNPVQFGAYSPESDTVALGESGGGPLDITVFDVETGSVRTRLTGHDTGINAVVFSPDGHTLASAGLDRTIRLWDLATGKEKAFRSVDSGSVNSISFSPNGAWLAFAGSDSTVWIWDLKNKRSFRFRTAPEQATGAENNAVRRTVPVGAR